VKLNRVCSVLFVVDCQLNKVDGRLLGISVDLFDINCINSIGFVSGLLIILVIFSLQVEHSAKQLEHLLQ
jgi:hypothetical protein